MTALAPGDRLGPYEVLSALGAGAMGEVYRARDSRLSREVAIKVLSASFASDADRLRRFEQEARAAGVISHPNLLTVFDTGQHDGGTYVVFELLNGVTLRQLLDKGPLSHRKALDYGTQIASGLAAAHEKGIVHRDLKPDNLFVVRDGLVKILDFGLAKLRRALDAEAESKDTTASEITDAGAVVGTVGYMSPEQVQGRPADHRSDIFSLGTVVYEMLSGRRAFKGASAVETMNAILKEEPPELSGTSALPPATERIVRRCLEKDPAARFQSARDLAFAFESLSGSGVDALARPPVRPVWPRLLAFVAALGLPLAGLAFGKRIWDRPAPSYERLTFRRGRVSSARVARDGQTIVYAAAWQGAAARLYSTRVGARESTLLDLPPGDIASISPTGELAILREEGKTLARVPLSGGAPRDLATGVWYADWSPDGKGLAIVRGGGGRLEYPIGKPLVEAGGIGGLRVSPQGDRVAFFGTDARGLGSVEVVDRAGGRRVLSTGWAWTRGLAWSPSGEEIWFTAKRVGERPGWFIPLYAVNLSGPQRLLMSLPAWTSLEDVSREGRVLMTLGSRQNEMFGRVPGAPQERDLAWNESSWAIDLSQDGRKLLFQEFAEESYREEGGGLYVRGTDGSPAVRIGEGYPGTLSPDGKQVAVCPPELQRRDRVLLIPLGAGETRTRELAGVTCRMVQWFPDGRKLLVRGERSGQGIREYLVDTEQGAPRPVTPEGTICISGSIFPNGRELACREAQDPQGVGFLYAVDGGEPRPVRGLMPGDRINGVRDDRTLSLERDGPQPGGWPAQLFWLDLATGRRTLFLELQPADPTGVQTMSLVASRDFRSYVYSYDRELNALYFVDGLR